jgi:hypothetical protein
MNTVLSLIIVSCSILSAFFWYKSSQVKLPPEEKMLSLGDKYLGDATNYRPWFAKTASYNARAAAFAAVAATAFALQTASEFIPAFLEVSLDMESSLATLR